MRKFVFLSFLILSSCSSLQKLNETCNETPSNEHLVSIRNVDFDAIGNNILANPVNHNIDYCSLHFLPSTRAGHEFIKSRNAINDVLGSQVHFTNTTVPHKTGNDLAPTNPTSSIFDYIDLTLPLPDQCFGGENNFALRMCAHDNSSQGREHFSVFVNAANYQHFNDQLSDDYPLDRGIIHELAHAVGMNHLRRGDDSLRWNTNDTKYISTMQGGLTYLGAIDVAYLRHFYPDNMPEHRNYVVGTKTRFPNDEDWYDTKSFFGKNPQSLYIDANGVLKDCETDDAPIFSVSWFNTGNIDGEPEICGTNRIFLRKKFESNEHRGITLKQWKIATMPHLSQDQWEGPVYLSAEDVAKIDFSAEYNLVFKVNNLETLDEITADDNEVSYPIEVHSSENSCSSIRRLPKTFDFDKNNEIPDNR